MRIVIGLIALIFSMGTLANDLYVTQSGATLTFDVLQDGQNNQIGNSTTASSVIGATANLNIDQVGNSNILKFDVNGASFTGTFSTTGNSNDIDFNCDSAGTVNSCATVTASVTMVGNSNDIDVDIGETADSTGSAVTITSAGDDDSNVIAATIDGTSAILTITVDGDTNNWLLDIDGNGDVNGHTYIHTHTGGIADVDVVQSGVYDNMVTLTTAGDNHNIDIIQRD